MSQETIAETEFASLRREIRPALATLAEKLLSDLGDNLRSLTVVGSAVTDDFHPQRSDINTVLLVARRSHELLHTIAGYGKTMGKLKLRAPLLMTDEYLQSSRDSFAVELLDFQLNHTTIIGPDPFAGLTFKKEDVRLQGERELKAALIKLRQGYISRLGRGKLIGQLLIGCIGDLLPLLRALLWLEDAERPRRAAATVAAAAERFDFETAPVVALVEFKQQHRPVEAEQVEPLFEKLYQAIDILSRRVDKLRTTP